MCKARPSTELVLAQKILALSTLSLYTSYMMKTVYEMSDRELVNSFFKGLEKKSRMGGSTPSDSYQVGYLSSLLQDFVDLPKVRSMLERRLIEINISNESH